MTNAAFAFLSSGIGAGLAIIGVGVGLGLVGGHAMEGIARQPSSMGDIRTSMLIAAALVEGAGLFAVVVCMLLALKT
ncbi:MAG TPA: ATP synthase F0 subunit C [Anaeromyxobacteraceae bacterium]|nr:ATP synthase F0 subunit C [Anaeromyxobacteraceae bacterium]